jgi:hypothetical protein
MGALLGALAAGRDLPRPQAGAPGPFGLADPDLVRHILTEAGFEEVNLDDVSEPIVLGTDVEDAYTFVRSLGVTRAMLRDLDADTAARALDEVRATIAAHDTSQGILFGSSAWILFGSSAWIISAQRR